MADKLKDEAIDKNEAEKNGELSGEFEEACECENENAPADGADDDCADGFDSDDSGESDSDEDDEEDEESSPKKKRRLNIKKKTVIKIVAAAVVLIFIAQWVIAAALYHFALTPGGTSAFMKKPEKPKNEQGSDSADNTALSQREKNEKWVDGNSEDKYIESADGTKLHGYYIKCGEASHSYAILCHPYTADAKAMAIYANHYYDLGFNILLPEARGHGESEGEYIGMGWNDRLDIVKWINKVISEDKDAKILLHGVSMGGATVMMVSGEKLPSNVRCIIEDCGYSSVWDEFKYQIGEMFSLPWFPVLDMADVITKAKAGWDFKEASALEQVKKSETPILFIHGDEDTFVPFSQCNKLYDACASEKDQLIVKGANHAQSLSKDTEKYWTAVDRFVLEYLGM